MSSYCLSTRESDLKNELEGDDGDIIMVNE